VTLSSKAKMIKVEIEQSLIDDLKVLHGIDAVQEITEAVRKIQGSEVEIVFTNNGDTDAS
jgi:hypothetical protein